MNKVVESVQPAQIIIYQSNTYRKNLSSYILRMSQIQERK